MYPVCAQEIEGCMMSMALASYVAPYASNYLFWTVLWLISAHNGEKGSRSEGETSKGLNGMVLVCAVDRRSTRDTYVHNSYHCMEYISRTLLRVDRPMSPARIMAVNLPTVIKHAECSGFFL